MIEAVRKKWTGRLAGRAKIARDRLLCPACWARWAVQAGAVFMLSGSRLMGDLSPFSAACCAAGLACGWSGAAMLTGCALFALVSGGAARSLAALAGCALIVILHALAQALDRRALFSGDSMRDALSAMLAFGGVLTPGVFASGGIAYNLITAFLSAAIAALLAPALTGALKIKPGRKTLMPDEQLSLCLLMAMLLIGLCSVPRAGGVAAQSAAVFLTLVFAAQGPALGALSGIACAAALALGTGVAWTGSALGLSGLLAGCAGFLPRPAAALALAAGNCLALTYGIGYTLGAVEPLPLILGALAYCALPGRWLKRAGRLMKRAQPRCSAERLAMRLRRDSGVRLERISRAFEALAEGYALPDSSPDEGALVVRLREAQCAGCQDYEKCWTGDHPEAGRLMCRLLSEAMRGESAPVLRERPPELVRHCRRSAQMDRRLYPLLNELAERCRADRARRELKGIASGQFHQTAQLLSELGAKMRRPVEMNEDMARLAAAALDKAGCRAAQISACEESGALEICAALREGAWNADRAGRAADCLSGELGVRMTPLAARAKSGECELRFVQSAFLTARTGVSTQPEKDGPCGDTVFSGFLPDGRLLAVISDGMGSGEAAAAESRRTVRLIRIFLEAGMTSARALEAVNALLQTRRDGELFATVDLCVADLRRGHAVLSKLGACSSLLVSGGKATELPGGHLPIGILEKITPGEQTVSIRPGDVLVMYSDGVTDDLQEGQPEWLRQAAAQAASGEPEAMALALRRAALDHHGAGDDMSVLVIRLDAVSDRKSPA